MRFLIILPLVILLLGCVTPQGGAIDMMEVLEEMGCKVESVHVRKSSYKIDTDC